MEHDNAFKSKQIYGCAFTFFVSFFFWFGEGNIKTCKRAKPRHSTHPHVALFYVLPPLPPYYLNIAGTCWHPKKTPTAQKLGKTTAAGVRSGSGEPTLDGVDQKKTRGHRSTTHVRHYCTNIPQRCDFTNQLSHTKSGSGGQHPLYHSCKDVGENGNS